MSLLSDLLSKKLTSVTKEQLDGATMIKNAAFYNQANLVSLGIPYSVEYISINAFIGCTALKEIDSDDMNPFCRMAYTSITSATVFSDTAWYKNHATGTIITMAKDQILIRMGSDGVIPSTIKNIAPDSCLNSASFVVPDTVEMVQGYAFDGCSSLTKLTIGSSVREITGTISPGTGLKNLIFRQPAGMAVELPTPGNGTGLAYSKDAYSMNIYTDNEDIKNYNWSGDNVTATFYPLSSAP